jgi:selenide,water dikinase
MGATPHSAMALVTLPYGEAAHQERMLQDLLSGTLEALTNEGASLVGGHTTEGPELSFGLTVNGYIDRDAILRKSGMSVGEVLILTKPLGTGLLLAADMRGKARGQWLEEATTMMLKSNATAAACLREHGATACTDVTGFGLAGHLIEMCQASKLSASLSMDTLPVLPGVVEVLATDIRSSLYPQNAELGSQIAPDNKSHTLFPILFDPQTAGGLLATVREEDAQNCLNSLHAAGFEQARVIGTVESVHPESCLRLL